MYFIMVRFGSINFFKEGGGVLLYFPFPSSQKYHIEKFTRNSREEPNGRQLPYRETKPHIGITFAVFVVEQ